MMGRIERDNMIAGIRGGRVGEKTRTNEQREKKVRKQGEERIGKRGRRVRDKDKKNWTNRQRQHYNAKKSRPTPAYPSPGLRERERERERARYFMGRFKNYDLSLY